jgi:hypothetical protein
MPPNNSFKPTAGVGKAFPAGGGLIQVLGHRGRGDVRNRITGLIGISFAIAFVTLRAGHSTSTVAWCGAIGFFLIGAYQLITGRGFS